MENGLETDALAALALKRIDAKTFAPIAECDMYKISAFERVYGKSDILADGEQLNRSNLFHVSPDGYSAYEVDENGDPIHADGSLMLNAVKAKITIRLKD